MNQGVETQTVSSHPLTVSNHSIRLPKRVSTEPELFRLRSPKALINETKQHQKQDERGGRESRSMGMYSHSIHHATASLGDVYNSPQAAYSQNNDHDIINQHPNNNNNNS